MITPEILELAGQFWNYHRGDHQLTKSVCILASGNHDLRIAHRAAELYLQGWANGYHVMRVRKFYPGYVD